MSSSELSLRLARPVDAAAIARLSRDQIEYGLRWRWTPKRVAASIRAPDVNVLVACVRENMAGFAIMRYGDDDAHLDLLAVAPPYRRAGVGRQLLEWLEKCAVVAGIFSVALEVRAGNEGAQRFYESMVIARWLTSQLLSETRRRSAWLEICRVDPGDKFGDASK